jgi:hypothetical protein
VSNTRTAKKTDVELAAIQLDAGDQDARLPEDERAEVADDSVTAELKGKKFAVAQEFSTFAVMEWVAADADTSLAATFQLLQSLVDEKAWAAFRSHAVKSLATPEELGKFINAAMEAISGRPTAAPGTS